MTLEVKIETDSLSKEELVALRSILIADDGLKALSVEGIGDNRYLITLEVIMNG